MACYKIIKSKPKSKASKLPKLLKNLDSYVLQEFLVGNLSGPGYWQLKTKEYLLQRTEQEIKKLTHRVILIKSIKTASPNAKLGYLAKLITNFAPLFQQEQVEEMMSSGKKLEYWLKSS